MYFRHSEFFIYSKLDYTKERELLKEKTFIFTYYFYHHHVKVVIKSNIILKSYTTRTTIHGRPGKTWEC